GHDLHGVPAPGPRGHRRRAGGGRARARRGITLCHAIRPAAGTHGALPPQGRVSARHAGQGAGGGRSRQRRHAAGPGAHPPGAGARHPRHGRGNGAAHGRACRHPRGARLSGTTREANGRTGRAARGQRPGESRMAPGARCAAVNAAALPRRPRGGGWRPGDSGVQKCV
ncbi:MAG: hypothetical protein AVDCRST_MAG77-3233, partial [uncultured Chloroflexi bacterium]